MTNPNPQYAADAPGLFDETRAAPTLPAWFHDGPNTPRSHTCNVANGRHPLGLPLLNPAHPLKTCGTCDHLCRSVGANKTYLKCARSFHTNGPGTDIRAKWPACCDFTPLSPTTANEAQG